MTDIFLYPGEVDPECIVLRDPTSTGGSFVVYTHTGSGTVIFSGAATLVKRKSTVATGSLLLSDTAPKVKRKVPVSSGSIVFSGTAPRAKRKAFQPAGSISFNGTGLVRKIKSAIGAGTILFSGTAPKDFIPSPPAGGGAHSRVGHKWFRNQN